MDKIVEGFNREHPKIQVKVQVIPWGTYYDKVTLGLAYGGAPDVFVLHAQRVPEYASHGALAPVDRFVKSDGPDPNDFMPTQWKAGQVDGVRYGLPLDCHPVGMYYNTKLFKEAGIDHPPTTELEFETDARKLTDPKQNRWGFVITDFHLVGSTLFDQFGGGVMTPDLTRSALNTSPSLKAVETMIGWVRDGHICPKPDPGGSWSEFQTGRAAMAIQGIWMFDSVEHQQGLSYAAAPVPRFGPFKAVWASSHCLCMPSNLPADRQRAGWIFIKYLSDHCLAWAQAGQVPIRKSILRSPAFRSLRIQREFAKELPYVVYEPFSTSVNQVAPFADSAVEAAVDGVETPQKALAQGAQRVNRVLDTQ
jgi:multiple sugar transport system substrate-binding protein